MSGKIKGAVDWIGRIQVIQSIVQSEFVRTLLAPVVVSGMTAAAGWFGNVPLMWILMATSIVFMATIQGILRASEYIERKNPLNKLTFVRTTEGHSLSPIPQQNRQQKRAGAAPQNLPRRHIEKIQLGFELRNDATFPMSVILENAESKVEEVTPPRTKYPQGPGLVMPGVIFRLIDETISLDDVPCGALTGTIDFKIKYGLPGREHFDMVLKANLEINFHPVGICTSISTHWM